VREKEHAVLYHAKANITVRQVS